MAVAALLGAVSGGGYISPWKLIAPLILLGVWARLLTWADKDAPEAHLPRVPLNISFLCGLALAYAMFFLIPSFLLSMFVLLLLFGAEIGAYLSIRQKKVGLQDLKEQWEDFVKRLTSKAQKAQEAKEGKVVFTTMAGPVTPPRADDPKRAVYDAVQSALGEPMVKGAEQIDLAPESAGLATKYIVDGVSYRGAVVDASLAAAAIQSIKASAGLNVEELRKPQQGTLKVLVEKKKHDLSVKTAGTRAGEYLRILVDEKRRRMETIEQLGLSARQLEQLKELIKKDKTGLILIGTPKGQGLTTALYSVLRAHDAFLEHVHTIEREPALDLEGITQNKLAATASPADETKQVSWIISQEPDVIMIDNIVNPQTAVELAKFAKSGKRVYVGMRTPNTFDAIEQWRKLVANDKAALEPLRLVIVGRVIRQLCSACKAGYAPEPATLRKLGISPDKVDTLYQARTQSLRDQKGNPIPCDFCHDLRFKGRRGIFETLQVDDAVREAAVGGQGAMNQAMRRQRGKYLQEEALALVEEGLTSVQEVLRVLKAAEGGASGGSPGTGDGGRATPAPRQPQPSGGRRA